eukprot:1049017-Prymnesium_polylepis.1
MRLISRNTAERRGDEGAEQPRKAKETPVLGRDAPSVGEDLLQVKRRILPGEALDLAGEAEAEAEVAAGAPAGKAKKIKIRKGGTVEGGKRTVFDDEGAPLEQRYDGFAQL